MLAAARHEGRMRQVPDGAKYPTRALLEGAVARGSVKAQEELEGPPFPEALRYLWRWFGEMDRTRTYDSMTGIAKPITYPILLAWAGLTGRDPEPREVEAILQIDTLIRFPDPTPPAASPAGD